MVKQTVIPKNVIQMAKVMQQARQSGQQIVIVQRRNIGKNWAIRIANNVN